MQTPPKSTTIKKTVSAYFVFLEAAAIQFLMYAFQEEGDLNT